MYADSMEVAALSGTVLPSDRTAPFRENAMHAVRLSKFVVLIALVFLGAGVLAHAGKITVENTTRYEVKMAFKFYDYRKKEWVVWGWYTVPPGAQKSWNFDVAPDRKIYWYGKTDDGKRYWPGEGDHGQSVINKKMNGVKASALRTYADSKVVKFKSRDPDAEGNLKIKLL